MKKIISICLILVISLTICACSEGSHWRGEYSAELRSEARIEKELYEMEQYKEAYNEGGLYAIHCFEGILQSIDTRDYGETGYYISADNLKKFIDNIEHYYGADISDELRDILVEYLSYGDTPSYTAYKAQIESALDSLVYEFKDN